MRVATFNVQSLPLMSQPHVVSDVKRAGKSAGVILWQEIGPDRYLDAVTALRGFETFAPHEASEPVSYRTRWWKRVDGGAELLHEGRAHMLGKREIVWVLLRHRVSRKTVLAHSVHYVARAWAQDGSAAPRTDRAEAAEQAIRQEIWLDGNERHRELLAKWVAEGHAVFGGGDFNRKYTKVVGTKVGGQPVHYLTPPGASLDYLFFIPNAKLRFALSDVTTTSTVWSDHPLRVARGYLRHR